MVRKMAIFDTRRLTESHDTDHHKSLVHFRSDKIFVIKFGVKIANALRRLPREISKINNKSNLAGREVRSMSTEYHVAALLQQQYYNKLARIPYLLEFLRLRVRYLDNRCAILSI